MSHIHKSLIVPSQLVEGDIILQKTQAGVQMKAVGISPGHYVAEIKREVTVSGPTSMNYLTATAFEITNYDDSLTYVVTSPDGTISRSGSTITLTCSNDALTTCRFIVNDVTYTINMLPVKPAAPTIQSPVNGATNVYPDKITITASAFALNVSGLTDTHLSTDWEVATDAGFSNIVFSRYGSTADKTSITLPD